MSLDIARLWRYRPGVRERSRCRDSAILLRYERRLARIIHERLERLGAFAAKTVGAGRLDRTKNAAQANDRARRPRWLRAAFHPR